MTLEQRERLNNFFVRTFNKILLSEERALLHSGIGNISVKELHILEAVTELQKCGQNTMTNIAAKLEISLSALTTAVNALVKKGFLIRSGREGDRRIVLVEPTESGTLANAQHEQFHTEMIDHVGEELDENSLRQLCDALDRLSSFFGSLNK